MDTYFFIITIAILILISGVLSMSESALFSLGEVRLRKMLFNKRFGAQSTRKILERPRPLLINIIIGNMFVNILAASLLTTLAMRIDPEYGPIVATIVMTVIIFIFAEIIPKTVGVEQSEITSGAVSPLLRVLGWLLYPITRAVSTTSDYLTGKQVPRTVDLSPEEVEALLHRSETDGVLDNLERDLIERVVELKSRIVKEVITPRRDIVALDVNVPSEEILVSVSNNEHSRIPVYDGDIETIIGILYIKDIFVVDNEGFVLRDLIRTNLFLPETMPIIDVFYEFRRTKQHIALIVDEYGSIAGLVTMNDLLEEITGWGGSEVRSDAFISMGEGNFVVRGDFGIEEVNKALNVDIEYDEAETVAGLVIGQLGKVPVKGDRIEIEGLVFQVLEVSMRRVDRLWIKKLST